MRTFLVIILALLSAGFGRATPLNDGSSGAPFGTPNAPGLFTNGAAGGVGVNYLATGGVRPPWNVAGVDYHVGYDTSLTLNNPTCIVAASCSPAAPGCISAVNATHIVTVNSGPCTIQQFDFSLGNGWVVNVSSSCTGGTILFKNNKFQLGSNDGPTGFGILNGQAGNQCGLDLENNVFDGAACNFLSTNTGAIVSYQGTGNLTFTAQYNQVINSTQHGFAIAPLGTSRWAVNIKYNYFRNMGYGTGAHGNPWINGGSSTSGWSSFEAGFNVLATVIPNGGASGDPTAVGACAAGSSFAGGVSTSAGNFQAANGNVYHNINVHHNVIFWLFNAAGGNFTLSSQTPPQGFALYPYIHDNYVDGTLTGGGTNGSFQMCFSTGDACNTGGGLYPIAFGGAGNPTLMGNIKLRDGTPCAAAATGNSSAWSC